MAEKIKESPLADTHDLLFMFANSSREDEDTLRFVNDVDRYLELGLVWVEALIHPDKGVGTTHRVVNYETACRDGSRFKEGTAKYGLPNQTWKWCTRELKTNPMESYAESIGWAVGSYDTAIGIRADETRRVSKSAEVTRIVYPLVDWWPVDKQDVLDHWAPRDWDLKIPEHIGNCIDCHKKSDKKLHRVWLERPQDFEFTISLDDLYRHIRGPNETAQPYRTRFRGRRDTRALIASFADAEPRPDSQMEGGCSESCELYEMEELTDEELWRP